MQALPNSPQRIILVNPTRYLGNLLIAGGLIQAFTRQCRSRKIDFRIVLDDSFRELMGDCLPTDKIIFYPRQAIARARLWSKARLYLKCLGEIRQFRADLAFNIEEDAVSDRLTRYSGARYRLGCSTARHQRGYEHVLPIAFSGRARGQEHRWYSFQEVFAALGFTAAEPAYLQLRLPVPDVSLNGKLQAAGLDPARPFIVLHAGATKEYKRWPLQHFVRLTELLLEDSFQVVFVGSGADGQIINAILARLDPALQAVVVNLCDRLSLRELGSFFSLATGMIGNDSGPSHLASALNVPGTVIFGPTEAEIWKPLGELSLFLQHPASCEPACSRSNCRLGRRCLSDITPENVRNSLIGILSELEIPE